MAEVQRKKTIVNGNRKIHYNGEPKCPCESCDNWDDKDQECMISSCQGPDWPEWKPFI